MHIGIDLVRDERIQQQDDVFAKNVLTPNEYPLRDKLPSIFALKEAACKALRTPPGWHDIRVSYEDGIPHVHVRGYRATCSVSHEDGMTAAVVLLQEDN